MFGNIFNTAPIVVELPKRFDKVTMYQFIKKALDESKSAKSKKIIFDFGPLDFIFPIGVVALSNTIEYLSKVAGCEVKFRNVNINNSAVCYLDDSGFFLPYHAGIRLNPTSRGLRNTTCPLQVIPKSNFNGYLNMQLMPWVAGSFGVDISILSGLRVAIEEVFHNINDHSGVNVGCTFSQYYPRKGEIHIAIADFGVGIPTLVKKFVPNIDDREAMIMAATEGFSTKSNVSNRGAGIPNLIRYVQHKKGSSMTIASSTTELYTSSDSPGGRPTCKNISDGFFPGTIVRVIISEGSLRAFMTEVEEEDFNW